MRATKTSAKAGWPSAAKITVGHFLVVLVALFLGRQAYAQLVVSDGGTPAYSQPIGVPPGIAGMSPKIGLAFSGGGVNGPVGYGWSIQGVSTITRCAAVKAIDNVKGGVTFGPSDKLCLDGQRLIQTRADGAVDSQTNDSAGGANFLREYRTEKDSYARIRAYGNANPTDGAGASGPAYFKVWTKSGQIYEYGDSSPATAAAKSVVRPYQKQVATVWAVSRISDTLGNFIDFRYEQRDVAWGSGGTTGYPTPGHEWNLLEIQYSGNKVVFNYDDRPDNTTTARRDVAEAWHMGSKNVSVRRLSSVTTYVKADPSSLGSGGALAVKTTKLGYVNGAVSGRSLVGSIQECAGAANSTRCLPATTFGYTAGGSDAYEPNGQFANSNGVAIQKMISTDGTLGTLTGDFDGDGKTDLLRWGSATANNQMWLSNGDGTFRVVAAGPVDITSVQLFSTDGCFNTVVADFNGDGISDLLRTRQATNNSGGACAAGDNQLYVGTGDGGFKNPVSLNGIDLSTAKETFSRTIVSCTSASIPLRDGDLLAMADISMLSDIHLAIARDTCYGQRKTLGKNFYVLDVDGDGILDIITTIRPAYNYNPSDGDSAPTGDSLCASTICTRVYRGNSDRTGNFTEVTGTNLKNRSVYADPPTGSARWAVFKANTVDVDGDGLTDLSVSTGVWRSSGNGDFAPMGGYAAACTNPIDFNGDGRADCLTASTAGPSGNSLTTATGGAAAVATPIFNLTGNGQELTTPSNGTVVTESVVLDINGDGRGDILRWSDKTNLNKLFLSNGDGTFTESTTFNIKSTDDVSYPEYQLKKSDGNFDFVVGDFTGRGNVEILRFSTSASPTAADGQKNRLFTKVDSRPLDQLNAVVSSTGSLTSLYYVPLTSPVPANNVSGNYGPRYKSDRNGPNAATGTQLDILFPMYVVATTVSENGVTSPGNLTEYSYLGLKADTNGRGLLGFREVRRQGLAPDAAGSALTVFTQSLQTHPYIGATARSDTRLGTVNDTSARLLSSTVNAYCDLTAGNGADVTAINSAIGAAAGSSGVGTPCPTVAKVQRPYLLWTQESGTDLANTPLPTVKTQNTFQASGDPSSIVVTTQGNVAGSSRAFVKTTVNTYQPDYTANDSWVLGRLARATVTSKVPDVLDTLVTSAGSSANATSTQGTAPLPPPLPLTADQLMPILQLLLLDD